MAEPPPPPRVLLVEDDEDDYVLTRELLADGFGGRGHGSSIGGRSTISSQ